MRKIIIAIFVFISFGAGANSIGDISAGKAKSVTCVACHGVDGNSPAVGFPKIAGQGEQYLYKQLQDFKSGARANAIMLGIVTPLSDEDMKNLAAYYSSQQTSPNVAKKDMEMLALGKQIYNGGIDKITACTACHGPTGEGIPSAKFPKIANQHAEYTEAQLKAFRQASINKQTNGNSPSRVNDYEGMMRIVAKHLTDDQIKALAQYIAGLH